ncbi:E3 ubiquitin-protein ligase RING1-like [Senna tora]|uniref:RING-type E3 ubiquitin transferase n=1 Tax=Senna tora TaxID=362788 RepID=A0A834WSI5_9FABA|nr:E3 ubiquitin-protein ligase RING1-like [Senna tora]
MQFIIGDGNLNKTQKIMPQSHRRNQRRNRESRKWYERICLVAITDSSASESETDDGSGRSDTADDLSRPPPNPESENTTPHSDTDEIDWRCPPPPPPPPLPGEDEGVGEYYYRSGGRKESEIRSIRITEEYKRERYSECPICKEELKVGEEARELRCNHSFCSANCIDQWLAIKQNCPLCWRTLYSSSSSFSPAPWGWEYSYGSTFTPHHTALQGADEYYSAYESPPPPASHT